MPRNTAELIREFNKLAQTSSLRVDVPADGSMLSEIAIVAEAPGETEVQKKLPLVGGSGKFLWDVLRKHNITRQSCYITNVIKRQVSLSKTSDEKDRVHKHELAHWEQLLDWELSQLPNLKYVLVLGNYALHAVTGETGITNWRGSVVPYRVGQDHRGDGGGASRRRVQVVCTFNPAMVLREPKTEVTFRFDIGRFARVIEGKWKEHKIDATINPSYSEAIRAIERLHDERSPIAFDIETIAGETACVGLANDSHRGTCISFRSLDTNVYSLREERSIVRRLQRLFASPSIRLVAQNGSFDSYWLWLKDRVRVRAVWFDTLLAHHTLYPRLPHSLAYLTAQYTDHPFYKDEGRDWRAVGDINRFWEYNVKDVCITHAVMQRELEELRSAGLDKFFFEHVMRLQPHLVRMTVGGVKCDLDLKERITHELREEVHRKREAFISLAREAVGDPQYEINPRSVPQRSDLFFRRLKLVGKGTSTDKENRERFLKHPRTSPAAKAVIHAFDSFIEDDKFLSTYAEMRVSDDGRIRCEYKQYGVQSAPGRLSSSKLLDGTGMNLQNQPERAQPMFIADDGYMFSYFDGSQAEARVVAVKANVKALRENFAKAAELGFDVHRMNAATIFKVPIDEIPLYDRDSDGRPTRRFLGKRCVHGLNYRMGYEKLATVCGIPLPQAMSAYSSYHRAFPEIQQWWEDTLAEVKRTRTLYNAYGRRLIILERLDDEALESIVAFYPQSTIGDKVARCIYLCEDDPEWPRLRSGHLTARMLLNVHDAMIAIHRPQDQQQVLHVMRKHMQEPILVNKEHVTIPADLKSTVPDATGKHRWSTLQKVKL